jgi:GT2 family glycosyltransferase/glycosyltransferase involved in cell wall biosynthesis
MPIFRAGLDLLLFAHVPKCAGTFVSSYLIDRFGQPALSDFAFMDTPKVGRWSRTSSQHMPAEILRRLFPSDFFAASFAFVREPVDRVQSAFYFQRDKQRCIGSDIQFDDWVASLPGLLAADPWEFDGYFAPMVEYVPDDAQTFLLEEGFETFTNWVDTRYGPSTSIIPRMHGRHSDHKAAKPSISSIGLIEELYAEDYLRFGYARHTATKRTTAAQQRGAILLDLGMTRFKRKELPKARKFFNAAIEIDPTNPVALSFSSVTEEMAGESRLAAIHADKALAREPRLIDAHVVRIRGHLQSDALDQAETDLAEARKHLGDLPNLDLLAAVLAKRRDQIEVALATAASAYARAVAGNEADLKDAAWSVWRQLVRNARALEDRFDDLVRDLGLKPGSPLPVMKDRPAHVDVLTIFLEDEISLGDDLVQGLLRCICAIPKDGTVVLIRNRDHGSPDVIATLACERARTGWAALGTAFVDEPDLSAGQPAPEAMRAAIYAVFAETAHPYPLPMLANGAVAFGAAQLGAALKKLDTSVQHPDDILPAVTLSLSDAGLGVATWAGAISRPTHQGDPILTDAALARLCMREGDLRALMAFDMLLSDRAAQRLGMALASAALPNRPRLLAAMIKRSNADLPVALRASAFAALWQHDPTTATDVLTALERGFDAPCLKPFELPVSENPVVSIILPAHNQIGATYCTLSALRMQGDVPPYEVILVDDGSTDETRTIETLVGGIRIHRHENARLFIAACNAGAALARGHMLVFLNNDTEPTPGWLRALLNQCAAGAGLAGARLILPDGRLQEAGGLLDNAASPANYGFGRHPLDPRYSYAREADYLSGAALMIPREVWDKVGGFSTYLDGMYFEDTDLACKVRAIGLPVRYAPAALVIHHEGTTSGRDVTSGPKALQEVNRPRFRDRWIDSLRSNPPADMPVSLRADHRARGRILFVDYSIPRPDNDAGGHATFEEIRMMVSAGWKVTFIDAAAAYLPGYVEALQNMGVEVLHRPFVSTPIEAVTLRGPVIDILYVSRYWLAAELIPILRKINPAARIAVNVADVHFLRKMREARIEGDLSTLEASRLQRRQEIAALQLADLVLCYSATEIAILWEASDGQIEAKLCPWVEEVSDNNPTMTGRAGLSFLGGFKHKPNLQGLAWFISEVLPLLPYVTLDVFGSGMGPEVHALSSSQVRMRGYVEDVSDCFAGFRIFVAPLLAGAGVKGKVIKALCSGIPCVLTPVAAEGLGLAHGVNALIVETPSEWAEAIRRLISDDTLWLALSQAGLDHARRSYGHVSGARIMETLLNGLVSGSAQETTFPEPALPAVVPPKTASLRFSVHFEVQHFGAPEPALWLADILANSRHSFHLNLDADTHEVAEADKQSALLKQRYAHFGLTRSSTLRWGGPSINRELLSRLSRSLLVPDWDYLINLSGTCCPLQPLAALDQYLSEAHDGGIRAHCFAFPIEDGPQLPTRPMGGPTILGNSGRAHLRGPATLLDWFRDPGRSPVTNPRNRLFVHVTEPEGERHLLDVRLLTDSEFAARRRLIRTIVPHAGRAWYVLHRSAVEALVGFLKSSETADFRAMMYSSFAPEESMIQTILGNGMIMSRENVRWTNLHRDNAAPRLYTDADIASALQLDRSFFLRKIDARHTLLLRNKLAERIR